MKKRPIEISGVFTIDTAISILETLAENMKDGQTLSEYFDN